RSANTSTRPSAATTAWTRCRAPCFERSSRTCPSGSRDAAPTLGPTRRRSPGSRTSSCPRWRRERSRAARSTRFAFGTGGAMLSGARSRSAAWRRPFTIRSRCIASRRCSPSGSARPKARAPSRSRRAARCCRCPFIRSSPKRRTLTWSARCSRACADALWRRSAGVRRWALDARARLRRRALHGRRAREVSMTSFRTLGGAGALSPLEQEILKEIAEALGRSGERLERAIAEYRTLAAEAGAEPDAGQKARLDAGRIEIRRAREALIIQREALGVRTHEVIDRHYPLPFPENELYATDDDS